MLGDTPYDLEAARKLSVGTIALRCGGWNDPDLTTETRRLSYDYKSATFRIATDQTDEEPGNWVSENQTIIPRFVPAVLNAGPPISTDTTTPTIIYASACSGLGISGPGDVTVSLLAQSDGWAWSKTP